MNKRNMMILGTVGALTALAVIPSMNSKTRKKMSHAGRNMYYKMSDIYGDIKD